MYKVQGNYGYGWDTEYETDDLNEALAVLTDYLNSGTGDHRLISDNA